MKKSLFKSFFWGFLFCILNVFGFLGLHPEPGDSKTVRSQHVLGLDPGAFFFLVVFRF